MAYSMIGADGKTYGPVESHILVEWARSGRIIPDTGIIDHASGRNFLARDLPELHAIFNPPPVSPNHVPMLHHIPPVPTYLPGHKFGPDGRPLKSKMTAGLLGIFLGSFGIHRFYLGYTGIGMLMLMMSTILAIFTCGGSLLIVGIWGIIDAILCFTGGLTDAEGRPLAD